jgi:hypothetical protein
MFLAIPAHYDASAETKRTIAEVLGRFGGTALILQGTPWIDIARTELVARFLESKEEDLLFIDSDIAFAPSVVDAMRSAASDLVVAPYKKRKPPHRWNLRTLDDEHPDEAPMRRVGEHRLIEVESDGLGACLVGRRVLERLTARHPELVYRNDQDEPRCWLFQPFVHPDHDGTPRPACDDRAFFLRARDAGFRVEALVDVVVYHDGIQGSLAEVFA